MTTPTSNPSAKLGDRSAFPRLQIAAYLNHAAISPASVMVTEAVAQVTSDFAQQGMGAFAACQQQVESLRARLAQFIGAAAPEDVAFVANTTGGVTAVALCFPWQRGDVVLLCEGEFPTNVTPWQRAAELYRLEHRWLPRLAPGDDVEAWLAILQQQLAGQHGQAPRLVALSAVQFQTGMRMPIERIAALCEQHGVQLFVDAIQGCGAVPLDVGACHIDYLACGSHKWMMSLPGLGMLYVAPERASKLRPHLAGWTSHEDAFGFLFEGPGHLRYDRPVRQRADFVEAGISNILGVAAWSAALQPLEQLGSRAIFEHINSYLDVLEPALVERGFRSQRATEEAARSGILSVLPPRDVDLMKLHAAIDGTRVSCTTPDGYLRFSPHWPNNQREIPALLEALDAALQAVRAG